MASKEELMEYIRQRKLRNTPTGKASEIIHNILNSSEETRGKREGTIKLISPTLADISNSIVRKVLSDSTVKLYILQKERIERGLLNNQLCYKQLDENTLEIKTVVQLVGDTL